jgi:hypothetical protein
VDALKCTDPDMKEVTQRYVAVAICDLIQGSGMDILLKSISMTNCLPFSRYEQVLHFGIRRFRSYKANFDIR